jgi:hypothetical protein
MLPSVNIRERGFTSTVPRLPTTWKQKNNSHVYSDAAENSIALCKVGVSYNYYMLVDKVLKADLTKLEQLMFSVLLKQ